MGFFLWCAVGGQQSAFCLEDEVKWVVDFRAERFCIRLRRIDRLEACPTRSLLPSCWFSAFSWVGGGGGCAIIVALDELDVADACAVFYFVAE